MTFQRADLLKEIANNPKATETLLLAQEWWPSVISGPKWDNTLKQHSLMFEIPIQSNLIQPALFFRKKPEGGGGKGKKTA